MKDVTQQLADALRAAEDALAWCYDVQLAPGEKTSPQHKALAKVRAALTAFEASRAAPADDVVSPSEPGGYVGDIFFGDPDNSTRGTHRWNGNQWSRLPSDAEAMLSLLAKAREERDAARAALSAMPRDEGLEALLAKALRRLAFWAQTSGGTAGRDDGLVAAIDVGLAALRQYDTKLAQEPRS